MLTNSINDDSREINTLNRPLWLIVVAWAFAFIPAFYILYVIAKYRPSVPYHDSWAFVKQYQDWTLGKVGWQQLFVLHNDHPSAVGKTIYFIVLHFFRGQVGLLPILSWVFSLGISIGALMISRPLWRGNTLLGAGLMFLANVTIFTGAQGHTWIWDFVFQNFIPGCCLVLGAALLNSEKASWQRLTLAFALSLISVFCFASGLFVGILLIPLAWWHVRECGRKKQTLTVGLWFLLLMIAVKLAFHHFDGSSASSGGSTIIGFITDFMGRPLMTIQYFLILIGLGLGQGTALEPATLCALFGLIMVGIEIAFLWMLWRRHDANLWWQAFPWLAMCGYATINAALITMGRMRYTLDAAIAPRYVTFSLFFPLGLIFLWILLSKKQPCLAKASSWMIGVLLTLQAVNWSVGLQSLQTQHQRMDQEKYALCFTDILPYPRYLVWQFDDDYPTTADFARFLKQGNRLRGVEFLTDNNILPITANGTLSPKVASFDLVSHQSDGDLVAEGTCGLSKDFLSLPDLVLLTAQSEGTSEKIVTFTMPDIPDDFYERNLRRRHYSDHYFGWSITIDRNLLPKGNPVTLRAYTFDGERRRAKAMEMSYIVTP